MASSKQKEALKLIEPLGYKPIGYTSNGELIVRHDVGYSLELHATPSDNKTMKNLVAEAKKGIKRMENAAPQFERWVWEKYGIQPGETKEESFSLPREIRQYLEEQGISRGASTNAISQWMRSNGRFANLTPEKQGPGKRLWSISRPEEPVIVQEPEPELLDSDSDEWGGTTLVEPEAIPQLNGHVPEAEVEVEIHPPVVVLENTEQIDPGLISRLQAAFNQPVQAELSEQKERLGLVQGELEAIDSELARGVESIFKAREMILSLIQLLEG